MGPYAGSFPAIYVAEGFPASSKGVRINFSTDGPAKPEYGPFGFENHVAGWWLWEFDSIEQAVQRVETIPFKEGRVEIRSILEDFGPEINERLKKMKEELAKKSQNVTK